MNSRTYGHHLVICTKCGKAFKQCMCMDCHKPVYFDICYKCSREEDNANPEAKFR